MRTFLAASLAVLALAGVAVATAAVYPRSTAVSLQKRVSKLERRMAGVCRAARMARVDIDSFQADQNMAIVKRAFSDIAVRCLILPR